MKYLIVNADDFGASPGITRGILEAHADGILTSTSMMVVASEMPFLLVASAFRRKSIRQFTTRILPPASQSREQKHWSRRQSA